MSKIAEQELQIKEPEYDLLPDKFIKGKFGKSIAELRIPMATLVLISGEVLKGLLLPWPLLLLLLLAACCCCCRSARVGRALQLSSWL